MGCQKELMPSEVRLHFDHQSKPEIQMAWQVNVQLERVYGVCKRHRKKMKTELFFNVNNVHDM